MMLPSGWSATLQTLQMGAILSQYIDEKWHPVAYRSRTLSEMERNYEIHDKELMASLCPQNPVSNVHISIASRLAMEAYMYMIKI